MSIEKRVLEQALWPTPGKKAKCGVRSAAAASAHFFHFDDGQIRAIYMEEGRGLMLSKKLQFVPGMGRLVSGGAAYAIGGNSLRGSHPREVWICDMNRRRGSDEEGYDYDAMEVDSVCVDEYPWRRGPDLKGPKRSPLVFAFRGKIYALCGAKPDRQDPGGPLFEVLDPAEEQPSWTPLPPPPDDMSLSLTRLGSHLVLGNRLWLYVRHGYTADGEEDIIFCFDLIKHEWVPFDWDDMPDGLQAWCGLWPTPPHAVGRDIHYHAGHFYAVVTDPDVGEEGLSVCRGDSLVPFLDQQTVSRCRGGKDDLKDFMELEKIFAEFKRTTDPTEKRDQLLSMWNIRNRMALRVIDWHITQVFHPFPRRFADPVSFEDPQRPGVFIEAILYPPETEEEDSRFRLLAHYPETEEKEEEDSNEFGASWGTLVLWTFSLDGKSASDVSSKLRCCPDQTGAIGGTPSIYFEAHYE